VFAVGAYGRVRRCVARAAIVAVWDAGTISDLAPDTSPADAAVALVCGSIALSVVGAVRSKTGAAGNVAQSAAEALQLVANADAIISQVTMSTAGQITASTGPARGTHALVAGLVAIEAHRVAVDAHPCTRAVHAHRRVRRTGAVATPVALRLAGAHRDAAVQALPVGADALMVVGVARSVSVAVAVLAGASRQQAL